MYDYNDPFADLELMLADGEDEQTDTQTEESGNFFDDIFSTGESILGGIKSATGIDGGKIVTDVANAKVKEAANNLVNGGGGNTSNTSNGSNTPNPVNQDTGGNATKDSALKSYGLPVAMGGATALILKFGFKVKTAISVTAGVAVAGAKIGYDKFKK